MPLFNFEENSIRQFFVKNLIDLGIKENNVAHRQEYSIEVQLPFIQYIQNIKNILQNPRLYIGRAKEMTLEVCHEADWYLLNPYQYLNYSDWL